MGAWPVMPLQKRATAELDSPAAGSQGPPLVVVGTTGLPFGPLRPRKAVPLYRVLWKSTCQSRLAASSEASWRKSRERRGRVPAPTLSDVATSCATHWIFHSKRDGTCQAVIVYPGLLSVLNPTHLPCYMTSPYSHSHTTTYLHTSMVSP